MMTKAELIAMLAPVPDDAEIYIPENCDEPEECNIAELRPPFTNHNRRSYWLLCGDYFSAQRAKFDEKTVVISLNGVPYKCPNGECGSTEFVQFAPAAFRCKACGCGYAAS